MQEYKIKLLGDGGVGKTTWLHKLKTGEFQKRYFATVGCEVHPTSFNTNYGNILLKMYDYAGQERYGKLDKEQTDGTILMFDQTSRLSHKNIDKYWKQFCKDEPTWTIQTKKDIPTAYVFPPYMTLSSKTDDDFQLIPNILRVLTGHDDLEVINSY
jgi:GTP-binding nuclear protein Ran